MTPGVKSILFSSAIDRDVGQWVNAINAAGGSVSGSTRNAASKFARSLKQAGIWDKCYMIDLCAGDNLTSALVRPKVPSGVARAYTNNNFVSGDYTETGSSGGLKGDGSSKYLDSGINPVTESFSNSSLGLWTYVRETVASAGTSRFHMSVGGAAGANVTGLGWLNAGSVETGVIAGTAAGYPAGSASQLTGLLGLVVNGSRAASLYQNGATVGAAGAAAASSFFSGNFYMHAGNSNNLPISYQNRRSSFRAITQGLTESEAAVFYNAVLAFETTLGRNV